jgi:hypothetical protein
MPQTYNILDPKQLRIIEKTHRGFLYQHLFAVGCLLKALSSNVTSIFVERDEDIEVLKNEDNLYIQVKTRSRDLAQSDVETALDRFDRIRQQHVSRLRLGSPHFYVISDADPNSVLAKKARDWPGDVLLITPGSSVPHPECLPPAWRTIEEALEWCKAEAEQIPFKAISAETLIWKLAAIVQHASAGAGDRREHEFRSSELPRLFEQIITDFHRLPDPPKPYRAQEVNQNLLAPYQSVWS